ncbi:MAG: ABC transporter permease [Actinomycetota bacterium]|nr:ABC transporter permease [Actinomycetota bacterium]
MRRALRRWGQYALVLWVALTLNFLLPRLAPGDPIDYVLGESARLSVSDLQRLRSEYGLEGSLLEQYADYWARLASGELGMSVRFGEPVAGVLADRVPWTVLLVGVGTLASALLATLAGAVAAWRRGGRRDIGLVTGLLTLDAMPGFWIGMLLISVFAVELDWLPSFGAAPLVAASRSEWLLEVARRLVLPVTTLVLATLGGTFLLARGAMLSTLDEGYVRMARAKGAPERRVVVRHALRTALLPIYTNVALSFGALLSGAVVVETVFAYPGLGRLLFEGVLARDYPLLQGAFVLVTLGVVGANLVADLTYPLLDPRVRDSGARQ